MVTSTHVVVVKNQVKLGARWEPNIWFLNTLIFSVNMSAILRSGVGTGTSPVLCQSENDFTDSASRSACYFKKLLKILHQHLFPSMCTILTECFAMTAWRQLILKTILK